MWQTGKSTRLEAWNPRSRSCLCKLCTLRQAICHPELQFPSLRGGDGDSHALPHRQTMGNGAPAISHLACAHSIGLVLGKWNVLASNCDTGREWRRGK